MNTKELKELVAKIESDTPLQKYSTFRRGPDPWSAIAPHCMNASKAYHGSLDAAKALHDALLPEWDYVLGHTNGGLTIHAQIGPSDEIFSDNVARAWLLGILKTLVSLDPRRAR